MEYTAFVEQFLVNSSGVAWYRGTGESSHKLVPSLYRHPTTKAIADLRDMEEEILNRFKQRSVPYLTRVLLDNWEYLFFMQHFGVPTRLLDWTENPYIALYFALTSAVRDQNTGLYRSDASVWALSPTIWNKKALNNLRAVNGPLSRESGLLDGYQPAVELKLMNSEPVAMYGTHNSQRIVAQRGAFTIFGRNTEPMEDTYVALEFPQDCLVKLMIPTASIDALLNSIIAIGISDSAVFPDLDGLARETKRFFGFRI